ncbi:hypothetical protein JMJ35_007507 [Cladonia borealis]|uniref:Uncharacterized protein n=1 Tax=Cladonia borealis TaxID=184061 RepID=A0AA39QYM3_9LECA|nr:hypothetical protein JMJ35_007507 [Cladonia borealis]
MHKIASERVSGNARKVPHYDPDPEPIKFGQQIVLRTQTPVPAAVLARLHSLYKNYSTVATELLATVMQGDETDFRNSYYRYVIRNIFEQKIEKEAVLAGIFPTFHPQTNLTDELLERFFAIYGVAQGANRELLGEAGDLDNDLVDIWCKDLKCSFNS